MILFKKTGDLRKWLDAQREKGNTTGFVPTMGALHKGHISLIEQAKKTNQVCLSSLFVNPTQFNDPKDFEKYPSTLEKDIAGLEAAGCDVLFLPSIKEMYPDYRPGQGIIATRHYDLGYLETILEAEFRPGHFQGVCMIVHRLLDIVQPDNLYLGQKDFQQCLVIKKLVELTGLAGKVTLTICPTLRETDGLAMSSRNMRLKEEERKKAAVIYQSLLLVKELLVPGNTQPVLEKARARLEEAGFRTDYVAVADANDLRILETWDGKQKTVVLIAAFMNEIRLIDNLLLN
jgi:pantoate--beta-alanine ligase